MCTDKFSLLMTSNQWYVFNSLACLRKIDALKRKIGRMMGKIGERCENKGKENR